MAFNLNWLENQEYYPVGIALVFQLVLFLYRVDWFTAILLGMLLFFVTLVRRKDSWLADVAHVLVGVLLTTVMALEVRLWLAFAATNVFGLIKEFVVDSRWEKNPPQGFKDNLRDYIGYLVGSTVAAALILRKVKL